MHENVKLSKGRKFVPYAIQYIHVSIRASLSKWTTWTNVQQKCFKNAVQQTYTHFENFLALYGICHQPCVRVISFTLKWFITINWEFYKQMMATFKVWNSFLSRIYFSTLLNFLFTNAIFHLYFGCEVISLLKNLQIAKCPLHKLGCNVGWPDKLFGMSTNNRTSENHVFWEKCCLCEWRAKSVQIYSRLNKKSKRLPINLNTNKYAFQ